MSSTVITVIDVDRINEVNGHHHAAEQAYTGALEHAVIAGRLLAGIKDELGHGQWLGWLEANFDGSVRAAQRYMQIATAVDTQPNTSGQTLFSTDAAQITDTSIGAVLREIQKPAPRPQPREAIGAVSGMEDDEDTPMALLPAALDGARDRLRAETPAPKQWDAAHDRRRAQILGLVEDVTQKLNRAAAGDLTPSAIADLLRDAEVKARQAMAQLSNLAFEFE